VSRVRARGRPAGRIAPGCAAPVARVGSLPAVFVKVCGITSEEDALLAVAMGADALGFLFAPSPRQITPTRAADIVKRLPAEIVTVGVFRDETRERVVDIAHRARLRAVQLHGHESSADTHWIRQRVRLVVKAFAAGDPQLDQVGDYAADAFLVDSATPGSGEVFDWSLAEGAPSNRRIILAGGLTPENVADAVRVVRPWGVDVSTGVESSPGRKDARKIRAFVEAARAAEPPAPPVQGDRDVRPFDWMLDEPA
jgi:phosphoribosylanthranilate isomerase